MGERGRERRSEEKWSGLHYREWERVEAHHMDESQEAANAYA